MPKLKLEDRCYLRLSVQSIHSYRLYLEVISSIHRLRTRRAAVTLNNLVCRMHSNLSINIDEFLI